MNKIYLGVDYGDARTGLASNAGTFAFGAVFLVIFNSIISSPNLIITLTFIVSQNFLKVKKKFMSKSS